MLKACTWTKFSEGVVMGGLPFTAALLSEEKNMKAFLARLTVAPASAAFAAFLAAFLGAFLGAALLGASAACRWQHLCLCRASAVTDQGLPGSGIAQACEAHQKAAL